METKEEKMPTEIIKFEQVADTIQNAGNVFNQNKLSHDKALDAANKLIEQAKRGVSKDLYDLIANLVKTKIPATQKAMLERRKPITQIMDLLKKEFTKMESDLGKDSPTIVSLQKIMNDFAAEQERIRKENEAKIIEAQKKAQNLALIIPDCKTYFVERFNDFLFSDKDFINQKMNEIKTIEDLTKFEKWVSEYAVIYGTFNNIVFKKTYEYVSNEEFDAELKKIDFAAMQEQFRKQYVSEMEVFIKETIDKIPTKKQQIKDALDLQEKIKAENDEAEKKHLKDIEDKRIAEEKKRIEEEKKALDILKQQEITKQNLQNIIQSSSASVQAKTAVQADLFSQIIPEVKVSYEYTITIKNPIAWVELFQFWFENQAKELSEDKIANFTMGRIKKYAEKQAENKNTIISDNLQYNEIIKGK